jgi:hypothetical protein
MTLREFAVTAGAVAGTTLTLVLLFEKFGKRHAGQGHDCGTTSDCEYMLACIDGKCVPDPNQAASSP